MANQKTTTQAATMPASGKGWPRIARSGQSRPGIIPNCGSCDTRMAVAIRLSAAPFPKMFRVWAVRKNAAPISAAMTWAAVRVRRGPISRNSPEASSSPTPEAARARAASTTRPEIQPGPASQAIASSGPVRK